MLKQLKDIYKKISLPLRIIVTLLLIFYIISKLNYSLVLKIFSKASIPLLLVSFLMIFLSIVISAYKWKIILRKINKEVKYSKLLSLYLQGSFMNNLFPSNIGGDGYKYIKLKKIINSGKDSFASIFTDRFSGIIVLFAISAISFIFLLINFFDILYQKFLLHVWLASFIFGLLFLLLIILLVFTSRFYKKFTNHKLGLLFDLRIILISLLFYLVSIINNYLISRAFGLNIPLIYFFMFIPLILLVITIPISFNGLGLKEASFIFLFGLLAISNEQAFLMSFTGYLLLLANSLLGGVLFLFKDSVSCSNKKLSIGHPLD